jgi:hypothetical protein
MTTKIKELVEVLFDLDSTNKSELPCRMTLTYPDNCPNEPLFRVFMADPCACAGGGVESCLPHKEDILPYCTEEWVWECNVCGANNGRVVKIERI